MAEFIKIGDSIEGQKLNIITRKKVVQGVIKIDGIGNCYRYLCKKNAKSTIHISLENHKPIYLPTSHVNENDTISGDAIYQVIY